MRRFPFSPWTVRSALLAVALTGSTLACAQEPTPPQPTGDYEAQQQPATRASVNVDLRRLEQVGYDPNGDRVTYPEQTQMAEQRAYPPTRAQYPVADTGQQPVIRRDVQDDLARLEQAGYDPSGDRVTYPERLQAAERKVGDIGPGE